eukprot:61094_1
MSQQLDVWYSIGSTIILLNVCVCAPTILYCYMSIKRYRDEPIMQHRDSVVIVGINIICAFMLLIDRPILIVHHIFNIIEREWISIITAYISMSSMCALYTIKGYCLFYRQKLNETQCNLQSDSNWYTSHQNTFGNAYHLIKLAIAFIIITLLIEIVSSGILSYNIGFLLLSQSFIVFLSMIVTCVILFKIRNCKDIYKIHSEVFLQFIVLLLVNIVYIVISSYCLFIPEERQPSCRLKWIIIICFTNYPFFFMTLSNTLYPVWYGRPHQVSRVAVPDTSPEHVSRSNSKTPMDMRLYISDKHGFESFMRYLVAEFACENLMFLKEYTEIKWLHQKSNEFCIKIPRRFLIKENLQLKLIESIHSNAVTQTNETTPLKTTDPLVSEIIVQLQSTRIQNEPYYTVYLVEAQDEKDLLFTKLMTPKNLPQGSIMRSGKTDPLELLCLLVDKYVALDGEHPLNISYSLRKYIMDVFAPSAVKDGVMNTDELFCILDECASDLLALIYSSFIRYCECDDGYKYEICEEWSMDDGQVYQELVCDHPDIQITIVNV